MTAERGVDEGHAASAVDGGRTALTARAALAGLQHSAAEAYTAITAADDALRALAGHRVTAERALRLAAARQQAAARAAAAHARSRPGPLAQLATRFRAGREWRRRRPALEAALTAAERQLATARQALSQAKADFTAQLGVRTAAAATLRRLTAECAAARAQIAALDGANPPAGHAAAILRHRDQGQ
jgi:chromosome segregation ATPase